MFRFVRGKSLCAIKIDRLFFLKTFLSLNDFKLYHAVKRK